MPRAVLPTQMIHLETIRFGMVVFCVCVCVCATDATFEDYVSVPKPKEPTQASYACSLQIQILRQKLLKSGSQALFMPHIVVAYLLHFIIFSTIQDGR